MSYPRLPDLSDSELLIWHSQGGEAGLSEAQRRRLRELLRKLARERKVKVKR